MLMYPEPVPIGEGGVTMTEDGGGNGGGWEV